jgi:hypothetical protein
MKLAELKQETTGEETGGAPVEVEGAHLDKPAAVEHPGAEQSSGVTQSEAREAAKAKRGDVAVVSKGAERIPVQLRDEAHLQELIDRHGAANVVVQS